MLTTVHSSAKQRALSDLDEKGITCVPGVLSKAECSHYISTLEAVLQSRMNRGIFVGNDRYQVIYNYFQDSTELFGLLYQDVTDEIMSELIDQDYVLISPAARNRQIRSHMNAAVATSGVGWHTDSRAIGRIPEFLRPTPIYFSVVALEDFSVDNGATFYIPGSHRWYRRPEDRNANLNSSVLEAEAGSLVYFDAALWHRVGEPSGRSRWSVFNMFGPWFMKPYFRFYDMFSAQEMKGFPPKIRQLLHWDSLPPKDATESTITLRRVREAAVSLPQE